MPDIFPMKNIDFKSSIWRRFPNWLVVGFVLSRGITWPGRLAISRHSVQRIRAANLMSASLSYKIEITGHKAQTSGTSAYLAPGMAESGSLFLKIPTRALGGYGVPGHHELSFHLLTRDLGCAEISPRMRYHGKLPGLGYWMIFDYFEHQQYDGNTNTDIALEHIKAMLEMLARVHSEELSKPILDYLRPRASRQMIFHRDVERFVETHALSSYARKCLHLALEARETVRELLQIRPARLSHGDPHPSNFLLHSSSDRLADIRVVDWEFWGARNPALDVVHLLVANWSIDSRRAHLEACIKHYCEHMSQLSSQDVMSVDLARAVIGRLVHPVFMWQKGAPTRVVLANLDRLLTAFSDLDCMAFV